ncbi:MAG: hypothetical protein ACYS1A_15850 [Planctomycetota bacterium]
MKLGLLVERINWIEKVVAVEKQVRFFLMVREKGLVPCCKPEPLAVDAGGRNEETSSKYAAGVRIKQVPSRRQQQRGVGAAGNDYILWRKIN